MRMRSNPGCRFPALSVSFALLAASFLLWMPSGVFAQENGVAGGDGVVIIDPPVFLPCPTLVAMLFCDTTIPYRPLTG